MSDTTPRFQFIITPMGRGVHVEVQWYNMSGENWTTAGKLHLPTRFWALCRAALERGAPMAKIHLGFIHL